MFATSHQHVVRSPFPVDCSDSTTGRAHLGHQSKMTAPPNTSRQKVPGHLVRVGPTVVIPGLNPVILKYFMKYIIYKNVDDLGIRSHFAKF